MDQFRCPACKWEISADIVKESGTCPLCKSNWRDLPEATAPAARQSAQALPSKPPPPSIPPLIEFFPPLADPMRVYRSLYTGMMCFTFFVSASAGILLWIQTGEWITFLLPMIVGVGGGLVLQSVRRLLPSNAPNAFYLRAFRNDSKSWPVRMAIQQALGKRFRLSGIRDPRRRWPFLIRHLVSLLFIFRYCLPKFMNLEAGRDWKARLWRSLADARCAFIDVTDVTSFVLEEIELCYHCLGMKRIMFVCDSSETAEEWRNRIDRILGTLSIPRDEVRLCIWEQYSSSNERFNSQVSSFADGLPPGEAGIHREAFSLTQHAKAPDEGPSSRFQAGGWTELLIGTFLGVAIWITLEVLVFRFPRYRWGLDLLGIVYLILQVLFYFQYLIECKWSREAKRSGELMFWGTVLAVGPGILTASLLSGLKKVHEQVEISYTLNSLKQLSLAMINTADENQGILPAHAIYSKEGKPLLSWRVAILPRLEEWGLYQQFKLDEPWDSPHNVKLLERIPTIYRPVNEAVRKQYPYSTFFQVFTGKETLFPEGPQGPRYPDSIADGTSRTLMIVEGEEPVLWTKPEDLPYRSDRPVPQLKQYPRTKRILGVLADCSMHSWNAGTPEKTIRAYITPAGHEPDEDYGGDRHSTR